jgi:prolyl 4-hydroxylase
MYGIRVYGEGAVMLPHVDRLPLVASASICVASDLDEDWPTEVYDHSGKAHNVTLRPGEMLLFESHSTIHGHPFPLVGRSYAMLFIHFEPTGNSLRQDRSSKTDDQQSLYRRYRDAVKAGLGGQSADTAAGTLPPYLQRASPEEENWRRDHPDGWKPPYPILPPEAHVAAKEGRLEALQEQLQHAQERQDLLTERDEHGWQLLHQGVAGGNKDVVKLLVETGAELNSRTHGGYGETPLRIAEDRLGTEHPIVAYLRSLGALSIGPEL